MAQLPPTPYQSALVSRNVFIGKHRTSMRLDQATWTALHEMMLREGIAPNQLYARIMSRKPNGLSFTVAVRQYLMLYFREAATEDGHAKAGHGAILLNPEVRRAQAREPRLFGDA